MTFIPTGVSYGQSNSDIEALHQAYCHVALSLGDADEQRTESNAMENIKSSVKDYPQENEESSKNISTTESGKKFETLSEQSLVRYNFSAVCLRDCFSVSEFNLKGLLKCLGISGFTIVVNMG